MAPLPALALRAAVAAFLARFDAFCAAAGRRDGGVSDALFGSSRKVRELREGKGVSVYVLADAETKLAALAAEAGVSLESAPGGVESEPAPARPRQNGPAA